MLLTMLSARLPCSTIFSRLPVSMSMISSTSPRSVLLKRRQRRRGRLLQLVEQLDRQAGEIVDEVERVLDLVRNSRRQLAERGHLFGLDQTGLGRLQVVQRRLGRIARRADFGFGVLLFALEAIPLDQAVAQHAKRSCHRPNLTNAHRRHNEIEFAVGDRRDASVQLLQRDRDRPHRQRGEDERERQRADPTDDRQLDRELRLTGRRIAPRHGPLLDPVDDPVDLAVDIENMALRLRQQRIAGGAVVARIGRPRLPGQVGHCVDFASNGGDERGIDCGDRLQIGVQSRFGLGGGLLRACEL